MKSSYYKNKYSLVFYDEDDEYLEFMVDNVVDLCKYMKRKVTRSNINKLRTRICISLKNPHHIFMIDSRKYILHLIDVRDESEEN